MRAYVWALVGLCYAVSAAAAPARVSGSHAEVQYDVSASARTLTYGGTLTSGSLLVVAVATYNTGVTVSVADGTNGSYTQINGNAIDSDANVVFSLWYKANNTATSAPTVTVTQSGSAYVSIVVDEYTGIQTSTPLRDSAKNSANSTTITTTNTGSVAGDLVVAGLNIGAVATISSVDAPFTIRTNLSSGATSEGIGTVDHLTAAGDESCTFHLSAATKGPYVIAAFIPAAGGSTPASRSLLGVGR